MNRDLFLKYVQDFNHEGRTLRECKDWLIGLIDCYQMPSLQTIHKYDVEQKRTILDVMTFAYNIAQSGHWKGVKYGKWN